MVGGRQAEGLARHPHSRRQGWNHGSGKAWKNCDHVSVNFNSFHLFHFACLGYCPTWAFVRLKIPHSFPINTRAKTSLHFMKIFIKKKTKQLAKVSQPPAGVTGWHSSGLKVFISILLFSHFSKKVFLEGYSVTSTLLNVFLPPSVVAL